MPVFGTDKKTRIGYCKSHQWKRTDIDRRTSAQKMIARATGEEKSETGLIGEKTDQDKFFDMAAKEIKKNPYCWETGDYISEGDYRASTAHIFPKSIFLSISCHPLNYLVLSPRNGSHNKTHRLDTFAKMDVWPIAIKRFQKFEHLITEKHKYLDQFKKLANDYIELHKTKPVI